MRIDLHCHAYPTSYLEAMKRGGIRDWDNVRGAPIPVWRTNEDRLADMDALGVDVDVLSLSSPGVEHASDQDLANTLSQLVNDFFADLHREYPTRFYGFATLPMVNVDLAIEELARAVRLPGIVGVTLPTTVYGKPLDAQEFWPFFEEVNRQGLPVLVHPKFPNTWMDNIREFRIYTILPYAVETSIAACRIVFSGLMDRFPNINWILCHLGGVIPYVYNRADWVARQFPEDTAVNISQPPSEYFKRFYYDTALNYQRGTVQCAIDLVGDDHIVFGTDIPWPKGEPARTVASLDAMELPAETREKILWRNAKKLLKIDLH